MNVCDEYLKANITWVQHEMDEKASQMNQKVNILYQQIKTVHSEAYSKYIVGNYLIDWSLVFDATLSAIDFYQDRHISTMSCSIRNL